jgi:hypothetical protein
MKNFSFANAPEWAGIAALSIDRDAVDALEADDNAGKLAIADLDRFGADHFHDHTRDFSLRSSSSRKLSVTFDWAATVEMKAAPKSKTNKNVRPVVLARCSMGDSSANKSLPLSLVKDKRQTGKLNGQ